MTVAARTVPDRTASRPAVGRRDERALVRAAQQGDAAAFEALFRAHWPTAYRAAWMIVRDRQLAEDIAQEAFVAAAGALDRFDRRRPFAPWLRTIVARRAIDAARTLTVRREVGEDALAGLGTTDGAPELSDPRLLDALAALPLEQRAVIVLRHLLGMRTGEIAKALGLPRGTVNSRLRRGLDALRPVLEDERR
ncbi:MAG TPA: sigma-70 family RNA polymerase sigma factor [Baekduia sp.]|nr:sigma-70 family RNA polymerase sigma factor [Baekduia sp.]